MIDDYENDYHASILIYVDDMLIIDKFPDVIMKQVQDQYNVRSDTIKEPSKYLGADVRKIYYNDGTHAWTMGSESYVRNAVKNIKEWMKDDGFRFITRLLDVNYLPTQPYSTTDYRPELDVSAHCSPEQTQFYQNILGILC